MRVSLALSGEVQIASRLLDLGGRTVKVQAAVQASARQLKDTIQAIHSGGRPSAIIRTYNLHDSWTMAFEEVDAVVGSGAPYVRRIEFGFVGVDSLGRSYAQPPYPMIGPAVEQVRPFFEQQVMEALK